jgi:hypothetical protein
MSALAPARAPVVEQAPAAAAAPASVTPVDLVGDPFAPAVKPAPSPSTPPTPSIPEDRDSVMSERRKRRTGMHPMAYAFIAMSLSFGGVAAYVLFVKPAPQPEVRYLPGQTVVVHDQGDPPPAAASASGAAETPATQAKPVAGGGGPSRPVDPKPTASSGPPANIDLSGFGNGGVAGPSSQGPGGPGGPSNGSGQLSTGEINAVVSQNQPVIRRKCWQPALEARTKESASSAKVTASFTIGPGGDVTSVNASGGDSAFPGLSSCIAQRIKNWKFPPSGGSTPVNVPFSFNGQ